MALAKMGSVPNYLSCLVAGILLQGCCVYTTYQTARTLPPGRVVAGYEVGMGTAPWGAGEGERPVMIDLGYDVRVGVTRNLEVGVRPLLLTADVKYQFLRGGLDGAFDLGVTYLPPVSVGIWNTDVYSAFGLHPMVLFSRQRGPVTYSYGARFIYHRTVRHYCGYRCRIETTHLFMPGVVLGLSVRLAARLRLSPEIGVYYCQLTGEGPRPPIAFGGGFGIGY